MQKDQFNERGVLGGDYPLKIGERPAEPEEFLALFEGRDCYPDVRKFVRRVDNDTGIPFLTKEEYNLARVVIPAEALSYYEDGGFISRLGNKVYLRGTDYYLNFQQQSEEDKRPYSFFALRLVQEGIEDILGLRGMINFAAGKAETIEQRMLVGSLLDLYKNHIMVLFTGLFESMKEDSTINVEDYNLVRAEVETAIDNYYRFIIEAKAPTPFISPDKLVPVFDDIEKVIRAAEKKKARLRAEGRDPSSVVGIYDGRRYLSREFDHPGRMVLYAGHLLSQIKERGRRYDLLVNLLNGSAEIGLAIQTIDGILGTHSIRGTTIFEVDFARYSMKDREDGEVSTYSEFESIAIPEQLRKDFRSKVKNKDTLVVDDNLNTGQSLYNAKRALEEIAHSVDISVVEVTPKQRVIELIEKDIKQRGIRMADPREMVRLVEGNLSYPPIGWWRDQLEMLEERRVERIVKSGKDLNIPLTSPMLENEQENQ